MWKSNQGGRSIERIEREISMTMTSVPEEDKGLMENLERGEVGDAGTLIGADGDEVVAMEGAMNTLDALYRDQPWRDRREISTDVEYREAMSRIDESLLSLAQEVNAKEKATRHEEWRRKRFGACCLGAIAASIVAMSIATGLALRGRQQPAGGISSAGSPTTAGTTPGTTAATKNHPPPMPGDIMNVLCDVSNVETAEGYNACMTACLPGSCCYAKHGPKNCSKDHPDVCALYGPCNIALNGYHGTEEGDGKGGGWGNTIDDDSPPGVQPEKEQELDSSTKVNPFVADTCDRGKIATSDESRDMCETMCQPRACCFDFPIGDITDSGMAGPKKSCRNLHPEWCAAYSPCESLRDSSSSSMDDPSEEQQQQVVDYSPFFVDGIVPDSVDGELSATAKDQFQREVGRVCDLNYVAKEGKFDCYDKCKDGRCCYVEEADVTDVEDCGVYLEGWCEMYGLCLPAFVDDDQDAGTAAAATGGGGGGSGTSGSSSSLINYAPFFSGGKVPDNFPENWTDEQGSTISSEIGKVCDLTYIGKHGRDDCRGKCHNSKCCFVEETGDTDVTDCGVFLEGWCGVYALCLPAFDTSQPLEESGVAGAGGSGGEEASSSSSSTSVDYGDDINYAPFFPGGKIPNTFPGDMTTHEKKIFTAEIGRVCDLDYIGVHSKLECYDKCHESKCCFVEELEVTVDVEDCAVVLEGWCAMYSNCLSAWASDSQQLTGPQQQQEKGDESTEGSSSDMMANDGIDYTPFFPGGHVPDTFPGDWTDEENRAFSAEIGRVCDLGYVANHGRADCRNKCKNSDCCFVEEADTAADVEDCAVFLEGWCGVYDLCLPAFADESSNNMEDASASSSSGGSTSAINFAPFFAGGVVPGTVPDDMTETEKKALSTEISRVCDLDYISSHGRDACYSECYESKCCFVEELEMTDVEDCAVPLEGWCEVYTLCLSAFDGGQQDTAGDIGSGETSVGENYAPFFVEGKIPETVPDDNRTEAALKALSSDISRVCDLDYIAAHDKDACYTKCYDSKCCFVEELEMTDVEDCAVLLEGWCEVYTLCLSAFDDGQQDTEGGSDMTQQAAGTGGAMGINYAPFFAGGKVPSTLLHDTTASEKHNFSVEVGRVCDLDYIATHGKDQCYSKCKHSRCCFVEETDVEDVEDCGVILEGWCEMYSLCLPAFDSSAVEGGGVVGDIAKYFNGGKVPYTLQNTMTLQEEEHVKKEVELACDLGYVRTDVGKADCLDKCKGTECCFVKLGGYNAGGDCYPALSDWCDVYELCGNMIALEVEGESSASEGTTFLGGSSSADTTYLGESSADVTDVAGSSSVDTTYVGESSADATFVGGSSSADGTSVVGESSASEDSGKSIPLEKFFVDGKVPQSMEMTIKEKKEFRQDVHRVCGADYLELNSELECEAKCSESKCCFVGQSGATDVENCFLRLEAWCDLHDRCESMFVKENMSMAEAPGLESTGGAVSGQESYEDIDLSRFFELGTVPDSLRSSMAASERKQFKEEVDVACKEEYIETEKGRKKCLAKCGESKCCYVDGTDGCGVVLENWCSLFSSCLNVFTEV